MIARSTVEVATDSRQLVFAPFDASHLRDALPVPWPVFAHQPAFTIPRYATEDPRHLLQAEEDTVEGETWGIFDPTAAAHPTAPEAFLGTISLYQDMVSGQLTKVIQEVATMIFRPDRLNMGTGTLAKLAIAKYAFERGTHVLRAEVSTRHIVAQRSLARAGFSKVYEGGDPIQFADGTMAPLEGWRLLDKDALDISRDYPNFEEFTQGLQIYRDAVRHVRVRERNIY